MNYLIQCKSPGCGAFSKQFYCEDHRRRERATVDGAVQCDGCEAGGPCRDRGNRSAVDESFLRAVVNTDPKRQARETRELGACWRLIGIGLALNLVAVGALEFAMGEVGASCEELIVLGAGTLWLGFGLSMIFGTPYIPGAPLPSSLPNERQRQHQEESRARECPFRFKKHLQAKAGEAHQDRIGRRVALALFVAYACHVIAFVI